MYSNVLQNPEMLDVTCLSQSEATLLFTLSLVYACIFFELNRCYYLYPE